MIAAKDTTTVPRSGRRESDSASHPPAKGPFAHKSEEEFARLLDFYHLAWRYEVHSFPVEWDRDGKPTRFFTPDFYLPEYDLYIEVTTLKQKLATRKRQKLRRFQTLYPEVKIKLLNVTDFRALMMKYRRDT